MHLRMNHLSLPKLMKLNRKVTGVPRPLVNRKQGMFPCHTCQDATSIRNDFQPTSENWADDQGLWSWDMIDFGEEHPTLDDNRYISIFVIKQSRFWMIFLHKDKSSVTNKAVLLKAFAYTGTRPTKLRSDGAAEYKKLDTWLNSIGIWQQITAPDQQFQNGCAEKFSDGISRGIRTLLRQSNLGVEFWGAAALYWVETRIHLTHSSIGDKIPIEQHTGRKPDIGWFMPFGCCATVFQGKDHVDHHKISARGEPGVFIWLGTSHGSKAWMVYCPQRNRIFSSRNVTFDETFFPLRKFNQRIYGKYDYAVVEEMRASRFVNTLDKTPPTESVLFPLASLEEMYCDPLAVESDDETEDEPLPSAPSLADALINRDPNAPDPGRITDEDIQSSEDEGVEVPQLSGGTSTNIIQSKKRRSNIGGRTPKHNKKVKIPAVEIEKKWDDCADTHIDECTDFELTEYLIRSSTQLRLNQEYWPGDKGSWLVECVDSGTYR